MSPAEKQALKTEYVHLAAYYQQAIDDAALLLYIEDLCDLPFDEVIAAMRRLRRQPGRRQFPFPADIRDAAAPQGGSVLAQANDVAGRISAAIGRYGYTQQERARAYVGELGWLIVERMGGWRSLCTSLLTSEMGTFRAQCRDLAKAQLELEASGARRVSPARLEERRTTGDKQLSSTADILAGLPVGKRACLPLQKR